MLDIIEYEDITEKLEKQWQELWEKSLNSNFFNTTKWFKICRNVFEINKIKIITITDNKEIVAIFPFQQNKNILFSPGGKYLDNSTILLLNNEAEYIETFLNFVKKNKYKIIINELSENLAKKFEMYKTCILEFSSNNPFANLNFDINEIVKSKERRAIKSIINKNEDIKVKIFQGKECSEHINDIFDIESKSNKVKKNKALFNKEEAKKIFSMISENNEAFLTIFFIGNEKIAHLFGIRTKKKLMAYHMAYKQEYYKLQPGKIIIYNLLEYLKKNKYEIFDFSRGDSVVKRHFSNNNIRKYNIYINFGILLKTKIICKKIKVKVKNKVKELIKYDGNCNCSRWKFRNRKRGSKLISQ